MDRYKGYTLIELVIVLALFSLLFSIAVPNFKAINGIEQKKELEEFRRDVLFARNQTIVTGFIHDVYIDYEKNLYSISSEGKSLKSHYFESGIRLVKNVFKNESQAVTRITFGRDGMASKSGSIFLEDNKGKEYRLSITPVTSKVTLYMDGEDL